VNAYPLHGDEALNAEEESLLTEDETIHDLTLSDLETAEFRRQSQQQPVLIPTLTVLGGVRSGQVFRLQRGRNLIGRDPQAHIFLDSSRISRQHCDIFVSAIDPGVESGSNLFRPKPCAEIMDLGSTNGTRVNGARMDARIAQKLHPRDRIDLGGGVTLAFGVMREEELNNHLRLYRSANQDELTGAYNKRHTMIRLEEELSSALRKQRPLSLVIFDLDHFKSINDTYGHDVGDIVLKSVARRVHSLLRREDVFGRFGGEEFLVLLRDTDLNHARHVAERIRLQIGRDRIMTADGVVRVTASLGAACSTELQEQDPQQLFKLADTRVYEAKSSGRNRVV